MTTPAEHMAAADAERKRRANCIARLALRGHVVHELTCGEFLVEWRGCMRHCRDLGELEQHARRVGVVR